MSRRSVLQSPLVWIVFAGIIFVGIFRTFRHSDPVAARVTHAKVPSFTLVNQDGEPYGSADLAGSVYVANFFFTSCHSICPALMQSMIRLQERFRKEGVQGVHLVSFSVDPERDTPERLRNYAEDYGIDTERWTLLTGKAEHMRELLMGGFVVPMGEPEDIDGLIDIAHSGKFVVVDASGVIQGYYSYEQPDDVFEFSRKIAARRSATS